MPKAKLTTKEAVQAIPHSKQGQPIYWCTELTGFGVRVGARAKTFILERRIKGKLRPVRITLGRVGQISLHKARQDAQQLIGEIVSGADPVARRRDETAGGLTFEQAWKLHRAAMKKKNRSQVTFDDYQAKIDAHLKDWLDLPLVEITRDLCNRRHEKIGENNGTYMANGCMRVVRAIWRRARRQYPELPESPTANVDFYEEKNRTAVITDWPAWWSGVQRIGSPVRRDFYIWLAFSGCRAGETMRMPIEDFDPENGVFKYSLTKTEAFEMPLSGFMVELLRNRIVQNAEEFGADCRWIFPSATAASGHLEEEKLTEAEPKLFTQHWSPHTLRHSWITNSDQKVKITDAHQRALTNHKLKRAKNGDSHAGYIHPDIDDLRVSQQRMTDYLLAQIQPTRRAREKGNAGKHGNVINFMKTEN
jgi:integrase